MGVVANDQPAGDAVHNRGEEFNRSLLRAIQEASPDGILVVDEHGSVVAYNRRFLEIWRLPGEHMQPNPQQGGCVSDNPILEAATQRVRDSAAFLRRVRALYANPNARDNCEVELKDGRTLERHSVGLRGERSEYLGRVWFFRDITERKRAEAALRDLAWRDPLTHVLNRARFFERAAEELSRARRHDRHISVIMMDLDHFKHINDQQGHAAGDRVLESVCWRWGEIMRSTDLLARLGGEEFAVLMPDSELRAACALGERLRHAIADRPISVSGLELQCTVSAGVAMVEPADEGIDDALRRADEALYQAKARGRNRVQVYAPAPSVQSKTH